MAVDERVLIRKVGRALGVDKDSAVCVIGLIIKMIEVPEIIIGIGDGVIDLGIRGIYPANDIGVLRMQSRNIHIDGRDLGVDTVADIGGGHRRRGGRGGIRELLGKVGIRLLGLLIAVYGGDDLIRAEAKHADENDAQNYENYFNGLFQKLRRPLHQEFIVIIQQSSPKEKPPFIHKWGRGIKSY